MKKYIHILLMLSVIFLLSCRAVPEKTPTERRDSLDKTIENKIQNMAWETMKTIKKDEVSLGWVEISPENRLSVMHFPTDADEMYDLGIAYYEKKIKWLQSHKRSYAEELISIYSLRIESCELTEKYNLHKFIYK